MRQASSGISSLYQSEKRAVCTDSTRRGEWFTNGIGGVAEVVDVSDLSACDVLHCLRLLLVCATIVRCEAQVLLTLAHAPQCVSDGCGGKVKNVANADEGAEMARLVLRKPPICSISLVTIRA